MKKIRKFYIYLKNISTPAYRLLRWSLIITCILLFFSAAIIIYAGGFSSYTYRFYCLSRDLYYAPTAILLAAIIGAAVIEERVHE